MTPPHPDILTVRDAEILRLLQKVVSIGEYRRQFTAEDVAHVVDRWLVPREAEVRYLRPVPPAPPVAPPVPSELAEPTSDAVRIVLPPGQAAALLTLAAHPGASNYDVGVLLDISEDAAKDRLRRAYNVLGVHDRTAAVSLLRGGHVVIVRKNSNGKRAS